MDKQGQHFQQFITEATPEELTTVANQLKETGDPEFEPLIGEMNRLAGRLIELIFPSSGTDMIPSKLVDIISDNLSLARTRLGVTQ